LNVLEVPLSEAPALVASIIGFHLTLADSNGRHSFSIHSSPSPSENALRSKKDWPLRMMIVDDEETFRMALVHRIHLCYKAEIAEAEDGNMALDLISDGKEPDLVLLDIRLPVHDGFKVYKKMRARGVSCPVIFMSADDSTENRERARRLGGAFVSKPLDFAQLDCEILQCRSGHSNE
jgi:CheY-like chemotaxis protein